MDALGQVRQGFDAAWTITLLDASEQPILHVYDGTEPLALVLWEGGLTAPITLLTSGVAWLSAAAGTITLALGQADTAALAPGRYDLVVALTAGLATVEAYAASVEIVAAPGSEAATRVYCDLGDLQTEVSWILNAVVADPDTPNNLLPQRIAARDWFEDLLHRHFRTGGTWLITNGLTLPTLLSYRRTARRNPWLQEQLDAGLLMLTAPVKKCCAATRSAGPCRG